MKTIKKTIPYLLIAMSVLVMLLHSCNKEDLKEDLNRIEEVKKKNAPSSITYYPNINDCRYFFQCSNGVAVLTQCPRDLWFCPISEKCDFSLTPSCAHYQKGCWENMQKGKKADDPTIVPDCSK